MRQKALRRRSPNALSGRSKLDLAYEKFVCFPNPLRMACRGVGQSSLGTLLIFLSSREVSSALSMHAVFNNRDHQW